MLSLLLLLTQPAAAASSASSTTATADLPTAEGGVVVGPVVTKAARTWAQWRAWRYDIDLLPAKDLVAVPQLRPVEDTVRWSWFGLRLLADVIDPWLIEPSPQTALIPGAPKRNDRCVAAPPAIGIDPIEPAAAPDCLAPRVAEPGTPLRVTPTCYEDGRMGVLLSGSL